jgi:hypothetical protein
MKAPWLVQVEPAIIQPKPFPNRCVRAAIRERLQLLGETQGILWILIPCCIFILFRPSHMVSAKNRAGIHP